MDLMTMADDATMSGAYHVGVMRSFQIYSLDISTFAEFLTVKTS